MQNKLPLINSAHGSDTRNIINELIRLFNGMGYTYNESLQKAQDVLNEAQKTNDMNKDVQNQLDNLIIESGNANAEVSQARGGLPLLKDRLDKSDAQLSEITTYVYLESFPRLTDEVDDTERIKRAISSLNEGETLFAKHLSDPYYISDTILVDKKVNVIFENDIVYQGARDRPVMVLKDMEYNTVNFKKIFDIGLYPSYSVGYHGWTDNNYVGIVTDNLKECDVNVEAIFGFTVGHKNAATRGGGNWFNRFRIKRLINNKIHLELNSDSYDLIGSWMNGNIYQDYSPGYSGTSFLNDTSEKYSVLQTLTNGNIYGGNTNIFERFKFETRANSPDNWTQVKLLKANGFYFKDYRYESNRPDSKFFIMDLSTYDIERPGITHSAKNILQPLDIIGTGHEIEFVNTSNVKLSFDDICKISGSVKKELFSVNNIEKEYRRLTNAFHTIKGLYRKQRKSELLNDEVHYDYSEDDLILNNGVKISSTYPIVIYLENIKKGDTFNVDILKADDSRLPTPLFKLFNSSGNIILPEQYDNFNLLAFDGYYQDVNKGYLFNNGEQDKLNVTVNHNVINTIAILINGNIRGFKVNSSNPESLIYTSKNSDFIKNNSFVHTGKPNMNDLGYWEYDEVVNNLNKEVGQVIGWQYKGNGTWENLPLME